jgi:hypothetical protein
MGHLTAMASTAEQAREDALHARSLLMAKSYAR